MEDKIEKCAAQYRPVRISLFRLQVNASATSVVFFISSRVLYDPMLKQS